MQLELGLLSLNAFLIVIVLGMVILYTFTQTGQGYGWPGKTRYAMYGVFSFVMIGMIALGYIAWLYIAMGQDFGYIFTIRESEYDLGNGFFTVLIGAFVGISLGLFALLKKQEMH